MPLPKESCGGPGGSIITKGDTNPYCKIIINDFVHTTEVRRNITNPMWDNAITM
jgi:Ca2+-dependent lipid-binding protein